MTFMVHAGGLAKPHEGLTPCHVRERIVKKPGPGNLTAVRILQMPDWMLASRASHSFRKNGSQYKDSNSYNSLKQPSLLNPTFAVLHKTALCPKLACYTWL